MHILSLLLFISCRHTPADKTSPNTQDTAISNPDPNTGTEPSEEPSTEPSIEPSSEPSTEDTSDTEEPDVDPEALIDADREGWVLVWRDEFLDSEIRSDRWEFEVNAQGGGNNESQYYTDRTENARIENGNLVIEARAENYTGPEGTRNYTSARLRTLNKGDWEYGRIEASIKLPFGQGIWPAFWMLPTDWVYGGWAASGEIDIMELVGHEPNVVHGTLHYGGPWPENTYSGDSYSIGEPFANDFHHFAVEWENGEIRWYVDGVHFQTQTDWYSTAGAWPAPFNQRFHVILNVAVGGNWPGYPDDSTIFPQRMEIDYVRVYERDPNYVPAVPKLTFTVDTSCTGNPVNSVALTGPWANFWDAAHVVPATDNGDGTWSVEMDLPNSTTEYLWVVNGNYENLISEMQNGASCAPVTDYANYANRVWNVGEADPFVTYDRCTPCP